ncbi:MAG: hypothetical protein MUE41_13935 [Gemmatimonadaceae bacterium]|jgi:hypothetical protein|nr:hypothetical protein [Gemmatimonadaceae bacterium]
MTGPRTVTFPTSIRALHDIVLQGHFDRFERGWRSSAPTTGGDEFSVRAALRELRNWLRTHSAADVQVEDANVRVGQKWIAHCSDTFLAHALALEIHAHRPGVLSESLLAHRDPPRELSEALITAVVGAQGQRAVAWRTMYTHLIRCEVFKAMAGYRLFETSDETLRDIEKRLSAIASHVDATVEALERTSSASTPVAPSLLLGTRARVALERGRIARAIGGPSILAAEQHLALALRYYQERVVARATERAADSTADATTQARDAELDFRFSATRSAEANLQLAYLNILRARCSAADALLRTAGLLAYSAEDTLLRAEIELVSLSSRRLQLSEREKPAISRATRDALAKRLLTLAEEEKDRRGRSMYAAMAVFQAELCTLYRFGDEPRIATPRMEERTTAKAPPVPQDIGQRFWHVSNAFREVRVLLTAARHLSVGRERTRVLRAAGQWLESAIRDAKPHPELHGLYADGAVYRIWELLERGEYAAARRALEAIAPSEPSDGFTTLPARADFVELLRIAVDLRGGDWRRASTHLDAFERDVLPRLEVGWLKDWAVGLRHELNHQRVLPDVDFASLRAVFSDRLAGREPSGSLSSAVLSLEGLEDALVRWLHEEARNAIWAHAGSPASAPVEPPTVGQLALLWGTNEDTVRKLSRRGLFDLRKSGHRGGDQQPRAPRADRKKGSEKGDSAQKPSAS